MGQIFLNGMGVLDWIGWDQGQKSGWKGIVHIAIFVFSQVEFSIAPKNLYKLQPTNSASMYILLCCRRYELKVKYPYFYARIVTIVTFFIKLLRLVHPTTLQKAKL